MHRLIFSLVFISVSKFCFAQHLSGAGKNHRSVSEVAWIQRVASDSAMQHEYQELFRLGYFYLDTGLSGIITTTGRFFSWKDSIGHDSIDLARFSYRFHYPGALPARYIYKPLYYQAKLYPDTIPFCKPVSLLSPNEIASITRKKLHVPLSECTVEPHIYRDCFGCDRKREVWSREGHPLLMIQHRRDIREKDGFVSKTIVRDFVVDAHSGKIVGRPDRSVYKYIREEN